MKETVTRFEQLRMLHESCNRVQQVPRANVTCQSTATRGVENLKPNQLNQETLAKAMKMKKLNTRCERYETSDEKSAKKSAHFFTRGGVLSVRNSTMGLLPIHRYMPKLGLTKVQTSSRGARQEGKK